MLIAGALLLAGFLCGSIPCGFLIARARGVDIRKQGSGNIGATNVWRVLGRGPGLFCFFLDFLKGLAPSIVSGLFINGQITTLLTGALSPSAAAALWLSVAVAAVLGHMFTPWLGFKGGKGIATGFGALIGVYPVFTLAAIVAIVVWGISLKFTRMVGISSVIAAGALALTVVGSHVAPASMGEMLARVPLYERATAVHVGFALGLLALIVYKHRGNIARTMKGTEPKIGEKKNHG